MKTISLWLFILAFAAFAPGGARAQESPIQQQIDQINGQIQDIYGVLDRQDKRITALEAQISDLQNKLNQPGGNNFASADDLKKLAEQVQEIDKKRQEDNAQILKALEKLDKSLGVATPEHKSEPVVTTNNNSTANSGAPQNGYWQTIGNGDTISAIAKAYQDKGIKVTVKQILDANPGLDPKNLKVGQKVWIPAPQ